MEGGGSGGLVRNGCQGGCERRIEVFGKIKKNGGGGGRVVGGGGGRRCSGWEGGQGE